MPNKYYTEGLQRADRVNALFSTIARRYDLINDLQSFGLHRWWKRRLVQLANVQPGERALDLCCGTGDVAFALARRGAEVTGLDFSEPMLEIARERLRRIDETFIPSKRVRRANAFSPTGGEGKDEGDLSRAGSAPMAGKPSINFIQGDALQIPFPDSHFQIVTISYGLRNLSDVDAGLREMHRVLRPGGRLLVLDFGKPDYPIWREIYFAYLRYVCPLLGRLFCGDPDTHSYILESLLHYAAQRGVAEKMEQLKFTRVSVANLLGGIMSINYGERPL